MALNLQRSVIAGAMTLATSQFAAADADPGTPLPTVLVTGSHIARIEGETAAPVTVLRRDDIAASGATTVRQVLDALTFFDTGALRDDGSGASFARGASGASLRGLGKGATLVLVNGRRVAGYALADGGKEMFVNLDAIGPAIIERVEVLRDGASAVYGSDALAGVINIITRRHYPGLGLSASAERPQGYAGKQRSAAISAGTGHPGRDGYHLFASLDAYQRRGFMQDEVMGHYPAWHKRHVNPAFGEPSLLSFPGNLNEPRADGRPAIRTAVAACPAHQLSSAGLCTSDLTAITQASDGAERVNVFSMARAQLAPHLQGFAELAWSQSTTHYRSLPFTSQAGSPWQWFNGLLQRSESTAKPRLAVGNPANPYPFPVGIDYRFMDDPALWRSPVRARQYRVLAGLEGMIGSGQLAWEVAAGRAGSSAASRDHGAHRDHFTQAVASGEYVIGGPNSAALLARMFPKIGADGRTGQRFVDGKLRGSLMALPGGALAFAAGAEYRREATRIASSANVLAADIIGRGAQLVDGERDLAAVYLELNAPLSRQLEINGALRADKAEGFDGHLSPRLGLRYIVTPAVLLRASGAHGFRAPNIAEALGKIGVTGFFNSTLDPRRCASATRIRDILATGTSTDRADAILAYNGGCLASVPAMISSNPQLQPETARSLTLGAVLQPARHVRVALDYFRITRRDEIAARDVGYVLQHEAQPEYSRMIVRNPVSDSDRRLAARANALSPGAQLEFGAGSIQALLLTYENFGRTLTEGVDLELSSRWPLGAHGSLTLGWTSTIGLRYQQWDIEKNAYRPSQIGLRGTPRSTSVLAAGWNKGPFAASVRVHRTSRTELNFSEIDEARWNEAGCQANVRPAPGLACHIAAATRTDVNVVYTGLQHARLALNVRNAFNRAAPVDLRGGYAAQPRSIKLSAQYSF